MRKKQDIMWEQSTLWESVEKWVTKYLKKNHSEYRELQVKAMRIVEENPVLRTLINSTNSKNILQNEKYKGDALLQKRYSRDFLDREMRKNEGAVPQYYILGNHEAIIDTEMFQRVQEELKRRESRYGK